MILRHIGIVVEDLNLSYYFWTQIFNFKLKIRQFEDNSFIEKLLNISEAKLETIKLHDRKNGVIELLKFHNYNGGNNAGQIYTNGLTHIALTVNNLKEILEKLNRHGYDANSKILKSIDGKVNVVFITGPENLKLELVQEL